MLTQLIADFIEYTYHINFKPKSRDAAKSRLKQLADYCESQNIHNATDITFQLLLTFITEFGYNSVHVRKSKIWALHQFFHFLTLKNIIPQNIALPLPYPKVGKKEPMFLTIDEFNQILKHIKQTGVSHSRMIHHQAAIKHFYSFLRNMNCIDTNPTFALLPIRRGKRNRRQAIDTDIAIRLLKAVDRSTWFGERDFLIMSCLWALGIRRQEAVTLTRGSFEPDIVPGQNIGLLRVHGKGDKERALFVVDQLYHHFIRYLNHPKTATGNDAPMFKSKSGSFMRDGDAIGKIVSKYTRLAGIGQHITPHQLRHGFATEMYLQGIPPEAIQAMMGHDNIEETAGYIHIPMQSKNQALKLLTINGDQHGC